MDRKYLPSKQFVARLIILVGLSIVIFGIYSLAQYIKNRPHKNSATPLIVKDVVQKDSNNNGIADWEETLWGLNPLINGTENKEYIIAKRKTLTETNTKEGTTDTGSGTSTENQVLAKQFFAVIMSLQESGNLNDQSLQSVVDAIGNKIVAKPIPDIYTKSMVQQVPSTKDTATAYIEALQNLFSKYKDKNIGDELTFIAGAIKNNDPHALLIVADIAVSYESLGKELIKIPTPTVAIDTQLALANDYEKTGKSLEGLTHILTDPIIGMQALINYIKYNDNLVAHLSSFSEF